MDPSLSLVATSLAILVVGALLPLVPAVIIYRWFPDTKVAASGPLSALTLSASGAFAAYLVVFLVLIPFVTRVFDKLDEIDKTTWLVDGTFVIHGAEGKPLRAAEIVADELKLFVDPSNVRVVGNRFFATVATTDRQLPTLLVQYGTSGAETVDLERDVARVKKDGRARRISLKAPIELTQFGRAQATYNPAGDTPWTEAK